MRRWAQQASNRPLKREKTSRLYHSMGVEVISASESRLISTDSIYLALSHFLICTICTLRL